MSMDNDTRLSMMALTDKNRRQHAPARRTRTRRNMGASSVATLAAFTLTLFTRGV